MDGYSLTDSLVDVVKLESVGREDQLVPFREGFLLDELNELIFELRTAGLRCNLQNLLENNKIKLGPYIMS
jgi:hypothetical protein